MKSYTDIEQSKVLAKILPLESADYFWAVDVNIVVTAPYITNVNGEINVPAVDNTIPCWSLAALLDIYPMVVGRDMDMYCCWQNHINLHSKHYDNPVDACVEVIIKLHELKKL